MCAAATRAAGSAPSTSGRHVESAVGARAMRRSVARPHAPAAAQRRRRQRWAAAAAAEKPDWFRDLEATAHLDEDAARLLEGAGGDPSVVQQRMREESDRLHARIMGTKYGGEEAPMEVSFRGPVEQYNLWVWAELYRPPTPGDLEMMQEVLNSWFLVGRLGGYNSTNLQVLYHQDEDLEDMDYDAQGEGASLAATFHDMAPLEARGAWARFWVDMGTADELALDILINALSTFSREQLGLKQLLVGGQNEDWPTPRREDFLPEVTMDPMRMGRGGFGGGPFDDDEEEEEEDGAYLP